MHLLLNVTRKNERLGAQNEKATVKFGLKWTKQRSHACDNNSRVATWQCILAMVFAFTIFDGIFYNANILWLHWREYVHVRPKIYNPHRKLVFGQQNSMKFSSAATR